MIGDDQTREILLVAMVVSGAAFETERQLQARLVTLSELFGAVGPEVRIRREMPVGTCIPDLLLVSFDRVPAQSILRLRWSYPHAHVVAELRRVPHLRRDTLVARMFDRRPRIDRLLDELIDAGALIAPTADTVRLSEELLTLRMEVIAVEAKLSRWSEALEQAVSYRAFADRSLVAMDADRVTEDSPKMTEAFSRAGIGLAVVDNAGGQLVHRGRTRRRSTPQKDYVCFSDRDAREHR